MKRNIALTNYNDTEKIALIDYNEAEYSDV